MSSRPLLHAIDRAPRVDTTPATTRLQWATWIQWGALTVLVAGIPSWLLALFLVPNPEATELTFAVGMVWASLTPPLIRWIGRRLRG